MANASDTTEALDINDQKESSESTVDFRKQGWKWGLVYSGVMVTLYLTLLGLDAPFLTVSSPTQGARQNAETVTCQNVVSTKTHQCLADAGCTNWFKVGETLMAGSGMKFCYTPEEALQPFKEGYNYKIEKGFMYYRFCAKDGKVPVSYRMIRGACPKDRLPS